MSNLALFRKIAQEIKKINGILSLSILALMVLSVGINVITRYIFKFSFRWCEEIVIIGFVYLVFLSIPMAMGEGSHVAIDYFRLRFPFKIRKSVNIFISIILMALCVLFIVLGISITLKVGKSVMPATHWPKGIIYMMVPVSSLLMLGYLVPILTKDIKEKEEKYT